MLAEGNDGHAGRKGTVTPRNPRICTHRKVMGRVLMVHDANGVFRSSHFLSYRTKCEFQVGTNFSPVSS